MKGSVLSSELEASGPIRLSMDPLSLAGLGLGAASLAFQLFAGCIKGLVLLSTAHNLGRASSTLVCMLNLQGIQLTDLARRAGLLSGNYELDKRLSATLCRPFARSWKAYYWTLKSSKFAISSLSRLHLSRKRQSAIRA